ncbi:MAG: hypothetical protein AAFR91_13365 [Pseudomonadota bacterium]
MIAAMVIFAIVFGVLRVLPPTKQLDANTAIAAVVPALILNWLLGLVIFGLKLSPAYGSIGLGLYFLVPFLWIRFGLNESSKLATIVGGVTIVVAFAVQLAFELILLRGT